MTDMLEPISLGYACDIKYQVSRNLYFRRQPEASETDFRNALFRWQGQASPFRRHIFDWAITPLPAVFAYLERDFQGVFERADLEVGPGGSPVVHRDLKTAFPHDFHGGEDGVITEAMLDEQHPAFRSKYEFLAQRFRDHLRTPGPYLYVYREIVPRADAQRLAGLLAAGSPEHRFQLLFVDVEGAVNQVLSSVDVPTFKGWLPPGCDKPADRVWEGPDEPWNQILSRFDIGLHGRDAPAPVAVAAVATGPAGSPPQDGWQTALDCKGAEGLLEAFSHVDQSGGAARYAVDNGLLSFDHPTAEDHFYCQFLPVAFDGAPGWARLTLDWPADGARGVVSLQDQECRHPRAWSIVDTPMGDRHRQTLVLPLTTDVDHVRLVATPGGDGHSALPWRIELELAAAGDGSEGAAPAQGALGRLWTRLFGRRR